MSTKLEMRIEEPEEEKQILNKMLDNSMSIENIQRMAFELADHACCGLYSEKDIQAFIEEWRKNNDC
jgi:hypothetical protein